MGDVDLHRASFQARSAYFEASYFIKLTLDEPIVVRQAGGFEIVLTSLEACAIPIPQKETGDVRCMTGDCRFS